jgi:hypothetical protein
LILITCPKSWTWLRPARLAGLLFRGKYHFAVLVHIALAQSWSEADRIVCGDDWHAGRYRIRRVDTIEPLPPLIRMT